jgi:hypothetical protein
MRTLLLPVTIVVIFSSLLAPLHAQEGTPPAAEACADGRMRIGDLEGADSTMARGIEAAQSVATAWEPDARLTTLILGCPLLMPGYRWQGIFFSETAQAYLHTDTGDTIATNDEPDTVRTLVTDGLTLSTLYRSLVRAGFTDDLMIDVSNGVTIRYNTRELGFGPPNAPVNTIYYHVAIEQRGEIKDVWVSAEDGTIYRY